MTQSFTEQLAALRASIDAIDDELIALFKKRIGIIHHVADLKSTHTPAACHIRPGREGEMHTRIYNAFKDSDFPPAAALVIWRQIIGASTHLESPITVAYAGEEALRWHAREYFGRNVSFVKTDSVEDALKAVENKHATIALLPAPSDENLADWARMEHHPALKAFAALPVLLDANDMPAGIAVAAVAPEPTGNDITLLLVPAGSPIQGRVKARNASHMLVAVDGFSTETGSIGTLPAPLLDPTLSLW